MRKGFEITCLICGNTILVGEELGELIDDEEVSCMVQRIKFIEKEFTIKAEIDWESGLCAHIICSCGNKIGG